MMMLAVVGLTFASCSDDDDTPTVGTVEDVNGEFTGKMTYAESKACLLYTSMCIRDRSQQTDHHISIFHIESLRDSSDQ